MKRYALLIAASAVAAALAAPTFAQTSGTGASPSTGPRPSEQSPTDGRVGGTGPLATPPANDPGPVQRPGGPTSSNPNVTPSDQMTKPQRPGGNAVEQSPTDGRAGGTGPLATPPANDPGRVQRPGGPTATNPNVTPSDQMARPQRPTGSAVEQSKTDGRSGGTGPLSNQPTHDTSTVRDAQQALQSKGFDVGPIDGVMGPRTSAALREFQQQHGLKGSGRLDRETLSELNVRAGS
jgi:hypothetical protein